ncbi:hypothetical protein D3C72_1315980 [compost metagenome]
MREHRGRTIAELVVQLSTDQQHHVGVSHHLRPRRAHRRRVVIGHDATALLRVEIQSAGGFQQTDDRVPSAFRTTAGNNYRSLCRPEHLHGFARRDGIRVHGPSRRGLHPVIKNQLWQYRGAQHISRYLNVCRSRFTHIASGTGEGLIEFAHDMVGDASRPRITRDGLQDVDVRDVLQRPHI